MLWIVCVAIFSVAASSAATDEVACLPRSEGNVLPYSEYLENKVIIDYFCPELKVMHVSYKGNKQHISATPIKNGEMMMVSTKEGYCGANKAMYYVKSLPHIDDVFYTSKRDKFELTKRSNTFYKGTEGGVAFYVW
ncbi:hypothetical protein QR680_016119 [Steinernema hermaphroditum]|uniref:Uncharacterized protein n=1 Tax=Steinernema hermaphroditum TaxID=289476 RepID=A0AA39HCA3_9BILA|nr:hypothetical protein QR680_016119 [Steinernema hermaphroditum]